MMALIRFLLKSTSHPISINDSNSHDYIGDGTKQRPSERLDFQTALLQLFNIESKRLNYCAAEAAEAAEAADASEAAWASAATTLASSAAWPPHTAGYL